MIIVVKYNYRAYATLCKEVRRTDRRIYVEYVAGDTYVSIQGRRDNNYVDIANVVTECGTPEQFAAIKKFVDDHNEHMLAAERAMVDERANFTNTLRGFVASNEPPARG